MWLFVTVAFFLGYRIVVYSFQAKEPSGHQTTVALHAGGLNLADLFYFCGML